MKIAFDRLGNCVPAYSDVSIFPVEPEKLPTVLIDAGEHATYRVPTLFLSGQQRKDLLAGKQVPTLDAYAKQLAERFDLDPELLLANARKLLETSR